MRIEPKEKKEGKHTVSRQYRSKRQLLDCVGRREMKMERENERDMAALAGRMKKI